MNRKVPVTAMLPAHARLKATLDTIDRILKCQPAPDEILVHVADSQKEMIEALEALGDKVTILTSTENLGPGGARNRMLKAASNEIVASFDDDSYPLDNDFFATLMDVFDSLSEASIVVGDIFEKSDSITSCMGEPRWVAWFVGCGCAYRRSHFIESDAGYVPIPVAYSMEEADLALRYLERGRKVFHVPQLRIYHDTILNHHASPEVAAMQIANTALFAFLRYPPPYWPLGFVQTLHKFVDTLKRRRWKGAFLSLPGTIQQICKYRSYRKPVSAEILQQYRSMRD